MRPASCNDRILSLSNSRTSRSSSTSCRALDDRAMPALPCLPVAPHAASLLSSRSPQGSCRFHMWIDPSGSSFPPHLSAQPPPVRHPLCYSAAISRPRHVSFRRILRFRFHNHRSPVHRCLRVVPPPPPIYPSIRPHTRSRRLLRHPIVMPYLYPCLPACAHHLSPI